MGGALELGLGFQGVQFKMSLPEVSRRQEAEGGRE